MDIEKHDRWIISLHQRFSDWLSNVITDCTSVHLAVAMPVIAVIMLLFNTVLSLWVDNNFAHLSSHTKNNSNYDQALIADIVLIPILIEVLYFAIKRFNQWKSALDSGNILSAPRLSMVFDTHLMRYSFIVISFFGIWLLLLRSKISWDYVISFTGNLPLLLAVSSAYFLLCRPPMHRNRKKSEKTSLSPLFSPAKI